MGRSVAALDRSGWSQEALERGAAIEAETARIRAANEARRHHPLYGVLDGASDASLIASTAPRYRLVARDFGNGHKEAVIAREIPDLQRPLDRAIDRDLGIRAARGEGDREASIDVAVRRAKQKVRHLCKAMIVNSLWTLTYRENVQDRELVLRHLDRFRRAVARVLGEWRYIAVLERQERGAYHVHLATHALPSRIVQGGVKVKSWNVMRAIWRRIVGDLGGNFDEAKRKRRNGNGHKTIAGAGAIARYIAGYVAKDMHESPLNRKRYSRSDGVEVPEAYRALFPGDESMAELIALAYAAVGERITGAWFDAERGVFFVESDDSGPVG